MKQFHSRPTFFAAAFLAAVGGSLAGVPARVQAAQTQATSPLVTPFERDPLLFTDWQQAGKALNSPDILQRRSGVEWLGRWTCTFFSYGIAPDKQNCAALQGQTELVPGLARAVQELPKDDSRQAARLLALIGPSAQAAIPAVCAELASPRYGDGKPQDGDDFVARSDFLNSLVQLCGGPDGVTPMLVRLMQDRKPETRRAAAAAVRFCVDFMYRRFAVSVQGAVPPLSPAQERQRTEDFHQQIIPALAACAADSITAVRLDALASLEWLTYESADAPWPKTFPALAHAVASPDPAVRLAALRVQAYMPADVSSLAPSLRSGLHGTDEERDYALAALIHAAQVNRSKTLTVFLNALASSNPATHRQAAADIRQAVMPLWSGDFLQKYPLPNWWNDSRLSVFSTRQISHFPPTQTPAQIAQWEAATQEAQPRLLAALAKETSDPDHQVRCDAVFSLEQIGGWVDMLSHAGFSSNPAWQAAPEVIAALGQAEANLPLSERTLAKQLRVLHDRLAAGPQDIY